MKHTKNRNNFHKIPIGSNGIEANQDGESSDFKKLMLLQNLKINEMNVLKQVKNHYSNLNHCKNNIENKRTQMYLK
jgi:hypothetical protein